MSDQKFLNSLLVLSLFLFVGFGIFAVQSVHQDIRIQEIHYLNGTLKLQKIQDPLDKESKGLFLYFQKINLEKQ